jgi:hypothetical protein
VETAHGQGRDEDADGAVVTQNERILERFMAKVEKQEDGCWFWIAATDRQGYGQFSFSSRRRVARAHRVAYELLVGPIPDGLILDHLCRNPSCVNPTHLEAVTVGENTLRGNSPAAQQARQTHCKRGHPFTPENTRMEAGGRRCRICRQADRRARTLRERADRLTGAGADPLSPSVSGDPSSSLPDERRSAPQQLTVWEAAA